MKIENILLDIDDVLNQCSKYALQWLGIPMDYDRFLESYPTAYGYDIVSVANNALGYERFTVPGFWNMIPRHFWATCPKSAEFDFVLDQCVKLVGQDGVCLLTGPTKDPDCLAGKLEWIERVLPPWLHRQYLIGPRKYFCAHERALLVDDSDANIDLFRAKRGRTLLVPRPWNTNHHLNTAEHLKQQFSYLIDTNS